MLGQAATAAVKGGGDKIEPAALNLASNAIGSCLDATLADDDGETAGVSEEAAGPLLGSIVSVGSSLGTSSASGATAESKKKAAEVSKAVAELPSTLGKAVMVNMEVGVEKVMEALDANGKGARMHVGKYDMTAALADGLSMQGFELKPSSLIFMFGGRRLSNCSDIGV